MPVYSTTGPIDFIFQWRANWRWNFSTVSTRATEKQTQFAGNHFHIRLLTKLCRLTFTKTMRITLALLAVAILGTSCQRTEDPDRTLVAMTHISRFHYALRTFSVDCGRFPTSQEGLSALIARPPAVSEGSWHGPYLLDLDRDPWGNNYCYLCPGLHNTNSFDLYSRGPDRLSRSGGDDSDDINNWSRK